MISAIHDSLRVIDLENTMPWTETTRPHYERRSQRYSSDSRDEEWAFVKPFMPPTSKGWATSQDRYARGLECDPVYGGDRVPVGDAAKGFPALYHGPVYPSG
jgi:hypothetical protein